MAGAAGTVVALGTGKPLSGGEMFSRFSISSTLGAERRVQLVLESILMITNTINILIFKRVVLTYCERLLPPPADPATYCEQPLRQLSSVDACLGSVRMSEAPFDQLPHHRELVSLSFHCYMKI